MARRPELAALPVALLAPDEIRRLWQVSPLGRHAGVRPGMTVSQAIGLCPALKLCEPDPVHYDEQCSRLLAALVRVSPVVEPAELGRVFVGMDGLERLYGAPEQVIAAITDAVRKLADDVEAQDPLAPFPGRTPYAAPRIGWGRGKFVAWVAASQAKPGGTVGVQAGEEQRFLSTQPLATLPLDPDTHRRMRQLGLKTLGHVAALPEAALVAQFGRAGRRLWRLAAGQIAEPVRGRVAPEPITAALTFFSPVGERELLVHALGQLIERALGDPRRVGWRVQVVRARAELEHGASWLVAATLKDPAASRTRRHAPDGGARSRALPGRSSCGSSGRCCHTSSRSNHGPASPSAATP